LSETLIVDSWPVLELFREREPATRRFLKILDQADRGDITLQMSRIIRGEIWYQAARRWGLEIYPAYQARLARLPIEVVSVDDALVDQAAELKARFSISYADCFAAALAIRTKARILTGDPDFYKLEAEGLLKVHWIGQ
jgi:predicted nucleic acid-binding protein